MNRQINRLIDNNKQEKIASLSLSLCLNLCIILVGKRKKLDTIFMRFTVEHFFHFVSFFPFISHTSKHTHKFIFIIYFRCRGRGKRQQQQKKRKKMFNSDSRLATMFSLVFAVVFFSFLFLLCEYLN